ncbi:MAG: SPOR domain-containing protein [Candidatus Omnitrophica bacterium]|nr:SPOR domain-containing protein [Candidatus Omnitrophota bacterium]
MNINPKRQSQFELFPRSSKSTPEAWKPSRLTKDLTLSLENIIVLCIIFVMVLVLFFSFGVERGKKVALLVPVKDEVNIVQTVKPKDVKPPVETVSQVEREERVVFPVDIPEEILEDSEPAFRPPLEKTEEQENLFTIQVASFKLKKNAKREADRLKGIGHDDTFVVPKGNHSIVCVGKFAQRNEAKKFSSKLKKRYNDCLVRRL